MNKLINYIIFKSSDLKDVGLYHGKMGIVTSLYLYAHAYKNDIIKNFAFDLLQEIYNEITKSLPWGLEYGLAGIGYGFTLLRKIEIIDDNLNDILYDIDSKIMSHDPRRISDFSYRQGIKGLLAYINLRKGLCEGLNSLDETYISELYIRAKKENISIPKDSFITDLLEPQWPCNNYRDKDLGIDQGISYFIIKDAYDKLFLNK